MNTQLEQINALIKKYSENIDRLCEEKDFETIDFAIRIREARNTVSIFGITAHRHTSRSIIGDYKIELKIEMAIISIANELIPALKEPKKMSFLQRLRVVNVQRNVQDFKDNHWTEMDWGGCAIAGEVGEMCNLLKKRLRGPGSATTEEVAKEMADVIIYLDLLAAKLGIDLESTIVDKFNEVSSRIGSTIKLT